MSNAIDMARPANDSATNMDPHLAAHVAKLAATPLFGAAKGYTYGADLGPKFARVWRSFGGAKSVVHFVNLATGAIHGAKSWKAAGSKTGRCIAVVVA
jgi:hypothetical protein